MKHALVIQHVTREQPGFILSVLEEEGFSFDTVDFQKQDTLPEDTSQYGVLVVLGGNDHIYDDTEDIRNEIAFVRDWLETGKPYFGICFGMQLMVAALGGVVYESKTSEIGFTHADGQAYEVHQTPSGMRSALLQGIQEKTFPVFQLHRDTVQLPDTIDLLASGNICQNQIIGYNNVAFGTQSHIELNHALLNAWLEENPFLATADHEQIQREYEQYGPVCERIGRRMFENVLSLA